MKLTMKDFYNLQGCTSSLVNYLHTIDIKNMRKIRLVKKQILFMDTFLNKFIRERNK